jgi:adenylate cyclase
LELQDKIVQSVVATLGLQLTVLKTGIVIPQRTHDLEAYNYYLRGLQCHLMTTPDAYARAREMFETAIAIDPGYADAYARLGFINYIEYVYQWDTNPHALDHAEELGHKALTLDDSNAEAHALLGCVSAHRHRPGEAFVYGKTAISLDPKPVVLVGVSHLFNILNEPEKAVVYAQRGMRLDPNHLGHIGNAGFAYNLMGRYGEALDALRRSDTNNPWVHVSLAYIYAELGQRREARAQANQVLFLAPNFSLAVLRKRMPNGIFDMPATRHYLDDLKKAGLR